MLMLMTYPPDLLFLVILDSLDGEKQKGGEQRAWLS